MNGWRFARNDTNRLRANLKKIGTFSVGLRANGPRAD